MVLFICCFDLATVGWKKYCFISWRLIARKRERFRQQPQRCPSFNDRPILGDPGADSGFTFLRAIFPSRLDFSLLPLSVPGSPRMRPTWKYYPQSPHEDIPRNFIYTKQRFRITVIANSRHQVQVDNLENEEISRLNQCIKTNRDELNVASIEPGS